MGECALTTGGGKSRTASRFLITGGAGFIGSHFCDRLAGDPLVTRITAYDNFSSGREWHVAHHLSDPRFSLIRADVSDLEGLTSAMAGHDVVIHLASNPDIAKAATEPTIDFTQGTALTSNVLEAARRAGVTTVLYASGSGVLGETAGAEAGEDYTPMIPISTYGASKMAGEALLAAYCHMFGMCGFAFRFANVIGSRQTHGVGFDFISRLTQDPTQLRILGDGSQTKSYIHVDDVVNAVLYVLENAAGPYNVFNVSTPDTLTVTEIADLSCEVLGLPPGSVTYRFTGGDRGWKGDVPVVRLDTARLRRLGWSCRNDSRSAMKIALESLLAEQTRGLT